MIKKIIACFVFLTLLGCWPVETHDPEEAYEYWAKSEPPEEIELLEGTYYQTPHFTLEYECFLKFRADKKWFEEFVNHNKLQPDTIGHNWSRYTKVPDWFNPDDSYLIYALDPEEKFKRSRYFYHRNMGICYIYQTIGM
ncbi:hypothetical protein ACJD0Z_17740 [Flavobacteriaceae bacterium M23B6Z8]